MFRRIQFLTPQAPKRDGMLLTDSQFPVGPIAVVQGAPGREVQGLFASFAARHRPRWRISGVIEVHDDAAGSRRTVLGNVADGQTYSLFQDLGPAATSCALRANGLIAACRDVCEQIDRGSDLVVLSKFGKLEAENGSGLMDAFAAALHAEVPVLTSVSPQYQDHWTRFAAPLFVTLPATAAAIDEWWAAVSDARSPAA